MTHAHHETQPNFDTRQVWKDGCAECHLRSLLLPLSVLALDSERLRYAWRRAYEWQKEDKGPELGLSEAEIPLLRLLWAFQVLLERECQLPLGQFPELVECEEFGCHRLMVPVTK